VEDAWFTGLADELARCLTDARDCADACERLLAEAAGAADARLRRRIADAVIAPAAVARVLIDLLDEPEPLVIAAATLCRDAAAEAAAALEGLDGHADVAAALRRCASSCAALLAAG
jgi:hypothetical protein